MITPQTPGTTAPRAGWGLHRGRGDRGGSDALGLALIAPAAIGMAIVILFLGRGVDSRATVQIAAESGAQAAAQERTTTSAITAGRSAAQAMLVDEQTCINPSVAVDVSEFQPGGEVAVTVTCSVSTAGLELIRPEAPTLTATAFATIDPLRAAAGGEP